MLLGLKMKFIEDFEPAMYLELQTVYDDRKKTKPFMIDIKPNDSNNPPLFVRTTDWDFSIDGKDARPGRSL